MSLGPALHHPFARPAGGVGDRFATWIGARIGLRPVQVVPGARVGEGSPVAGPGDPGPGDRGRAAATATDRAASGASDRVAIVVGGGLAGASAAMRLAARGFRVRVLEREAYLGGKLGAWTIDVRGRPYTVEHGFHGFFLQYYNLWALCLESGIGVDDFPLVDDYAIADAQGRVEGLRRHPRVSPFNVLSMALRSPFLNLREARRMKSFRTMRDAFLLYDVERTPELWDGLSFADLTGRMGLADTGFDAVFKVFGHSFFSDAAEVSAAEIVKNFHFFFFGNPEGLLFRHCRTDFERGFWTPVRRRLEALGGAVELAREVVSIRRDPASGRFTVRARRAAGASAPADADALEADAVVLAVDPPGLRAILAASAELRESHACVAAIAEHVPPAQPYAVVRLWGDRDCDPRRCSFTSLHGHAPLDSVTVYHRMEGESADWVRRHGGGIFELHSYTPRPADARDEEALEAALVRQLSRAMPELAGMRVLHRHRHLRWDFPSFPVGAAATRPRTATGVPGLVLAGDWVRIPIPAALMEGAVASGIFAANALLAEHGLAPEPVWSVPTRGVLTNFMD